MSSKGSSRKAEVLLEEATLCIHCGCYNMAVSAAYFASQKALEDLIKNRQSAVPRRHDKLINILAHLGHPSEARTLKNLYDLRKMADYSDHIFNASEAEEAVKTATKLIESIEKLL